MHEAAGGNFTFKYTTSKFQYHKCCPSSAKEAWLGIKHKLRWQNPLCNCHGFLHNHILQAFFLVLFLFMSIIGKTLNKHSLCTSQFQNPASPPPGIYLRTVGNLTQNEARPFRVKTPVSDRKQKDFAILWSSTCAAFTGHSTWVLLLLSLHYIVISWNRPLFKVWREDKLNKKFVVAENFSKHATSDLADLYSYI